MLRRQELTIAGAALACSVSAVPVWSDEFTDSLAAIRHAMDGHWIGVVRGSDASGEAFEVDDAFTFVVTSEDGLDSAQWSADALEIATHEGEGIYRIRNWNLSGGQNETQYLLRIERPLDASGNAGWVLELEQTTSDGTVMDTLEHFSLNGDTMRMLIEMRPLGSDGSFETVVTGSWAKVTE